MVDWVWFSKDEAVEVHGRQLAVHGGPKGIRDEGLLESALARAENLSAYGDPDLAALAAAYAFGIARNHPFVDGNKRASFATCATFLRLNGFDLPDSDDDDIAAWLAPAAGASSEADMPAWLRARILPLGRARGWRPRGHGSMTDLVEPLPSPP